MKSKDVYGNRSGRYGAYEIYQTIDWKTLLFALALAVASWGSTFLVPALENEGGWLASAGAVLAILLRVVVEFLRNNSDKRIVFDDKG